MLQQANSPTNDREQDDFLTVDNAASASQQLRDMASKVAPKEPSKRASTFSTRSKGSMSTDLTFLPTAGGYGVPLEHLCRLIDAYPTLREGKIISSECYTSPMPGGLVHRFLMLELRREGRKTIWARLDRTRLKTVGAFQFFVSGGRTDSNDIVSNRALESDNNLNVLGIGAAFRD